jgi:hypothetical protein
MVETGREEAGKELFGLRENAKSSKRYAPSREILLILKRV